MSDVKSNTYNVTLTGEQINIINRALDAYSRILILQLEDIKNVLLWQETTPKDFDGKVVEIDKLHEFGHAIGQIKKRYFNIDGNASHGIHSPNVPDVARKAYDIQQTLRNKLAWDSVDKDPIKDKREWGYKMITVDFDDPHKTSKDINFSLPSIEKISEKDS